MPESICFRAERGGNAQKQAETGTPVTFGTRRHGVRVSALRPNKNESYDTKGIATFVLFFLSKTPIVQGFLAMRQKSIVSLSYPPALISMLFRGVLTPCSDAEIHNETFLKRIISL